MKADQHDLFQAVSAACDAASGGMVGFITPDQGKTWFLYAGTPDTGTIEVELTDSLWDGTGVDPDVLNKRAISAQRLRTGVQVAYDTAKRTGIAPVFVAKDPLRVGFEGLAEYPTADADNAGLSWTPVCANPPAWDALATVDLHAFADTTRGAFQLLGGRTPAGNGVYITQGSNEDLLRVSVTDSIAFRVEELPSASEVPNTVVVITPTVSAQLRQLKKVFPKGTPLKLLVVRNSANEIIRFGATAGAFTVTAGVCDAGNLATNPVLTTGPIFQEIEPEASVTVSLTRKEWAHAITALSKVGSIALLNFDGVTGEVVGLSTGDDSSKGEGAVRITGGTVVGVPSQVAVNIDRLKDCLLAASSTPGAKTLTATADDDDDDKVDTEMLSVSIANVALSATRSITGVAVTRPSNDGQRTFLMEVRLAPTQVFPFGITRVAAV